MSNISTINSFQSSICDIDEHINTLGESVEIGIPRDGSAVSVFISGGVDSAIMTYLVVKSVQKFGYGNKIYPITSEFMQRPFNIKHAYDVLRVIESSTGFKFSQHLIFPMPNHLSHIDDQDKKPIMSENITEYRVRYGISVVFNGLTANPPIEEVPDNYWGQRQVERDDISLVLLKLKQNEVQYPFLFLDKRSVSAFYEKYEMLYELFDATRSCESEMDESKYFTKTCFDVRPEGNECWWCREREYGFADYRPEQFIHRIKGNS
jgi:hypothetical protein